MCGSLQRAIATLETKCLPGDSGRTCISGLKLCKSNFPRCASAAVKFLSLRWRFSGRSINGGTNLVSYLPQHLCVWSVTIGQEMSASCRTSWRDQCFTHARTPSMVTTSSLPTTIHQRIPSQRCPNRQKDFRSRNIWPRSGSNCFCVPWLDAKGTRLKQQPCSVFPNRLSANSSLDKTTREVDGTSISVVLSHSL